MFLQRRYLLLLFLLINSATVIAIPKLENENLLVWLTDNEAIRFSDKKVGIIWGNDLPDWIELFDKNGREKISLMNTVVSQKFENGSIFISFKNLKGKKLNDFE